MPEGIPDFWMIALRNSLEEGEVRWGCWRCSGVARMIWGCLGGLGRGPGGGATKMGSACAASDRCSSNAALTDRPRTAPVPQINDKDAEVLCYCTDVRCERFYSEDGDDGEPDEVRTYR